jgi:DNA-3-methyladenine glycosylase II
MTRATRITNDPEIRTAVAHLRRSDRVLAALIEEVGPFTLKPTRDRFEMLVRSIVSQQISTSAARSIRARLEALAHPQKLTPQTVSALAAERLRSAGLSRQKATYLSDLAQKCADGQIQLNRLGRLPDEKIIDELTRVKGIGHWTAQMFLIFALRRLDVFPHGDLGIRTALKNLYSLDELPDRAAGLRIADSWRPYATVASWYCWRSLDLRKATK